MNNECSDRMNRFGQMLYEMLINKDVNHVFSPYSIHAALSMTSSGTAGKTCEEMLHVLQAADFQDDVHEVHKRLLNVLQLEGQYVKMKIANSIWGKDGVSFCDGFVEGVSQYYEAKLDILTKVKKVNHWIKEETEGYIDHIIDHLDEDILLLLLNIVYFKGKWSYPFEPYMTANKLFISVDGEESYVPFMGKTELIPYLKSDEYESVSLSYGDGQYEMDLLLPTKGIELKTVIEKLSKGALHWLVPHEKEYISLFIPKFNICTEWVLNEPLKKLGMKAAFHSEEADLSKMVAGATHLFMNEVKHISYIEINEEGIEAAAATSIGVRGESMPIDEKSLQFNRPFLFRVRHKLTGVNIFQGHVVKLD